MLLFGIFGGALCTCEGLAEEDICDTTVAAVDVVLNFDVVDGILAFTCEAEVWRDEVVLALLGGGGFGGFGGFERLEADSLAESTFWGFGTAPLASAFVVGTVFDSTALEAGGGGGFWIGFRAVDNGCPDTRPLVFAIVDFELGGDGGFLAKETFEGWEDGFAFPDADEDEDDFDWTEFLEDDVEEDLDEAADLAEIEEPVDPFEMLDPLEAVEEDEAEESIDEDWCLNLDDEVFDDEVSSSSES